MITSVLVANRGEIARRVLRTCRRLGIGTVAVFSDADAAAPHVDEADAAVRLPGSAPGETYLRADLIVAAAGSAGADAIHPGYGFLAENAAFARAVAEAGLTWIGPPPDAIEAMGSKIESKRLMAAAGVPVLDALPPEAVTAADLPVLIKASAGGGGRGMRVVRDLAALPGELELARTEAASAFGDAAVFCERYLATGRHLEVQIMADGHGTVWTLGERECSIQRRHQKIIEEAPSPLAERVDGLRERLLDAAQAAAKTVAYAGTGTVEFLVDAGPEASPDAGPCAGPEPAQFFFLEMNTRLQVEHPVTECTTGLDLVELQLHVAGGGRLDGQPPPRRGHAIEARLYAEDPAPGWQPQTGTLHRVAVPGGDTEFEAGPRPAGVRVDSGVRDGSLVGVHYDPLLAKVISWAPTRDQAARCLAGTLARSTIHGVLTNRDLLVNVLRHQGFLTGRTDTAFIERYGLGVLARPLADDRAETISALAAALALDAATRAAAPVLAAIPSGWRNVVSQSQHLELDGPSRRHAIGYRFTRAGLALDRLTLDGVVTDGIDGVTLVEHGEHLVVLDQHGVRRRFAVARYGSEVYVDSPLGGVRFTVVERFADPAAQAAVGSLLAPMPGTVVRIAAVPGATVRAGQPILWLEAMKMQHQISAPADGVLTELPVGDGQQVDAGAVLAVVTPEETA